jgi:ribonuclease P protein component
VLARGNRVHDGPHLGTVWKKGRRVATPFFVASTLLTSSDSPRRFGFIVSKQVGGAVVRNRVKRQLRALAAGTVAVETYGADTVIRATPSSATASFDELAHHWAQVFGQG